MDTWNHISPKARIGADVEIGFGVRIYDNVEIGSGSKIADHCVIGYPTSRPDLAGKPLEIGCNANIRSHSVLYESSAIGAGLETGHHVVIREGTKAGQHLRVGNFSDIEGDCCIGDFCRFHGYVHVGKGSQIGHFVWLFSLVTLTNDPLPPSRLAIPVEVQDGAVLAVGVTPLPGTRIGKGAFIAANSQVSGRIPAGALWHSGKVRCGVHRMVNIEEGLQHPWMSHYKDAFPENSWERIDALLAEVEAASRKV